MQRRTATIVLIGALVTVLFAAVATSGDVQYIEGPPSFARDPDDQPVPTIPLGPEQTDTELRERPTIEIPGIVLTILQTIFIAGLIACGIIGLVYSWRHRPRLRWRRRRPAPAFEVLDDVAASITASAEAQRDALRRGAPRNAIVECWTRLESAVVQSGVPRSPADTSAELTQRVLATYDIDPDALDTLASLYREARFSSHDMAEADRQSALLALNSVHDGLRRGAAAAAGVA